MIKSAIVLIFFLDFWCLVNNAGVAVYAETEWCPLESYTKMIEVNLIGVIRVTKLFLPLVRKSKGRIVNISSLAGIYFICTLVNRLKKDKIAPLPVTGAIL